MSVSSSRLHDTDKNRKYAFERAVRQKMLELDLAEQRKKHWLKDHGYYVNKKPAICSKCRDYMARSVADAQIENKREDAPICVACILGKPRKKKL